MDVGGKIRAYPWLCGMGFAERNCPSFGLEL